MADETAPAETTEVVTPEPAAPATPDAFGSQTAPEEEAKPPEIGDALAQLNARFDAIEGKLTPEPEAPADPWEALNAQPEAEEPIYEPDPNAAPEQAQTADDQLVAEFNQLVDQRVNEIVQPHFQQQELGRRKEAIDALAQKYPDFAEAVPEIGSRMQALATKYGQPEMATDPELAESLYQARKAIAIADTETPAEAAGQGAHLETGVGNGNGDQGPSLQEQYLGPIMATIPDKRDVFS